MTRRRLSGFLHRHSSSFTEEGLMEDQEKRKTPDSERKEVEATQAMLRAENEGPETPCGDLEQKHEASELQCSSKLLLADGLQQDLESKLLRGRQTAKELGAELQSI